MPLSTIFQSSWSGLLVEETEVPGENRQPVTSHIMLYRVQHQKEASCIIPI